MAEPYSPIMLHIPVNPLHAIHLPYNTASIFYGVGCSQLMECGVYFYIDLTNMLKENEVGGSSKMGVGLFLRLRDLLFSQK